MTPVPVTGVTIVDLGGLILMGTADDGTDTVALFGAPSGTAFATAQDSVLNLQDYWTAAEFNVFGPCCGSEADFNSGSAIVIQTNVDVDDGSTNAPSCASTGFTGETNNLTLVSPCISYSGSSPGIEFMESYNSSSTPPSLNTGTASSITGSSAVLSGSTNPNGSETLVWYLYDTNSSGLNCGNAPILNGQAANLGAGTSTMDFTANLGGLSAGTTYYFVACALYPGGVVEGSVASFTTSGGTAPPVLVSPANGATGVPVTTSLTWNAVPGSAGYEVYLGTTDPPGIQTLTGSTYFTPSTPLNPSTLYYWQIASRDPNNGNAESPSPVWSFITGAAQETVSTPSMPSGPTSGTSGVVYSYSTGGSADNLGNPVQYLFNWGDGTNSGWLSTGTTSASHSWPAGSYGVTAQARSATNTAVVSSPSSALTVNITAQESISAPSTPSGPTSGTAGTVYSYSTGGSTDNLGNPVQYLFNWGDGTNSGWLGTGTTSASHSWAAGSYGVTAQARSATNTSVVSSPSGALTVNITVQESVSAPSTPSGPTNGTAGTVYSYSTGGSTDNLGNPVQYLFNWGDGTNSSWLTTGTTSATHSWAAGSYSVSAQARSTTNTSVVSAPSGALPVNITPPESVSTPSTPSGPSSGTAGTVYSYSTGGSSDNLGNPVQYLFNWGDGTNSSWLTTGTTSATHSWAAGSYSVSAQARSTTNTSVVSAPSGALPVNIGAPAITSPAPGSTLSGSLANFSWNAVSGATEYQLSVGTTPGGANTFSGTTAGTSQIVGSIPCTDTVGGTIYVQLAAEVNGSFQSPAAYSYTCKLGLGNYNGDGHQDVLWQNNSTAQVTVHYFDGTEGATDTGWNWLNESGEPSGWVLVGAADFDGNGVPDLVWEYMPTGQVTVNYYGGPGGATYLGWNWLISNGNPGWTVVAVADMDGNGVPDLIWQNNTTNQVTVNYFGGAGGAVYQGWNWLNSAGEPAGWHVVAAADFDGNGTPDLVWQYAPTRQVTVNYYGGAGGATYQGWNWLNSAGDPGWTVVGASDFNGDGVPDLVWQNDATAQVTVNYYGGTGGASYLGWNWLAAGGYPGWKAVVPR
jgi:hypothetical protein